jgi:hypothetical protein
MDRASSLITTQIAMKTMEKATFDRITLGLGYHAKHLPRKVTWYTDPAGAREIHELRCADFIFSEGDDGKRPGIAAVRARRENGTMCVLQDACPNLLAEAIVWCAPFKGRIPGF